MSAIVDNVQSEVPAPPYSQAPAPPPEAQVDPDLSPESQVASPHLIL